MPKVRNPRFGSMQFWPRARAKRPYARITSWPKSSDAKILGFAGYKAGMTHIIVKDNRKTSLTKNTDVFCPVTVIECPPLKACSIRFYKNTIDGLKLVSEIFAANADKELGRKLTLPKKKNEKSADGIAAQTKFGTNNVGFDDARLMFYTQPKLTGIGKKKPEVFEVAIGGSKEQQLDYAKEKLGKEISIDEVFKEGQQVDIHAVTKGKGFQGPVKRFGVTLRSHKSEKSRRGPGSLGAWNAQGKIMYRVAHAGKMGFHKRTEYNKTLMKIGKKSEEINVKGGYLNYGLIKNPYILVKGSIAGVPKRLIRMTMATRPNIRMPTDAPEIEYISLESKQGN